MELHKHKPDTNIFPFLQLYFSHIWDRRPKDIESSRTFIDVQTAVAILKAQSRLSRKELCSRLNVDNSRLAYLEARCNFNPYQFKALIGIAEEYFLPNLAEFFTTRMGLSIRFMDDDLPRPRRRRVK